MNRFADFDSISLLNSSIWHFSVFLAHISPQIVIHGFETCSTLAGFSPKLQFVLHSEHGPRWTDQSGLPFEVRSLRCRWCRICSRLFRWSIRKRLLTSPGTPVFAQYSMLWIWSTYLSSEVSTGRSLPFRDFGAARPPLEFSNGHFFCVASSEHSRSGFSNHYCRWVSLIWLRYLMPGCRGWGFPASTCVAF